MTVDVELVLAVSCVAGLAGMAVGWVLRQRRVHNEHWLWKKQRLSRARILLRGGAAVSVLSSAAFVLV